MPDDPSPVRTVTRSRARPPAVHDAWCAPRTSPTSPTTGRASTGRRSHATSAARWGPAPRRNPVEPRRVGGRHATCTDAVERVTGIEPAWPAWKAGALPLSYTREVVEGSSGPKRSVVALSRALRARDP